MFYNCKICNETFELTNNKRKLEYNLCNLCSNKLYKSTIDDGEFIVIKKYKPSNIIKAIDKKKTTYNNIDNVNFNNIIKIYKNKLLDINEFLIVINYDNYNQLDINKFWDDIENDKLILLDNDLITSFNYNNLITTKKYIYNYLYINYDNNIDYINTNKTIISNNTKSNKIYNKTNNIFVSIHTFKCICKFLNTQMSKQIKQKIIELEKIYKIYNKYLNFYKDIKLDESKLIQNLQINKQLHKFTEYIYIVTTKPKAKENIFKIGRTNNLKSRLSTYNTGSSENEKYFYCSHFKCTSASTLENRIFTLLKNFKIDNEKEMFQLHYEILHNIIKSICNNDKKISDNINQFIEEEYDNYLFINPIEF
jgi:hypothetical protein